MIEFTDHYSNRYRVDLSGTDFAKSSLSADNGACVEVAFVDADFRSASNSGDCVEFAEKSGVVALRDSKNPDGPILLFTSAEWKAFVGVDGELGGVKGGQFDI